MPQNPATRRVPAGMDDIDAITPCPPLPTSTSASAPSPTSPLFPSSSSKPALTTATARSSRSSSPVSDCGSSSSRSGVVSGRSSFSMTHYHHQHHRHGNSDDNNNNNNRRRNSLKALEEGTGGDPERLWRRMLALQQEYGCYNSARMRAALESGDASLLLPSKACLDLMNEDIGMLPEEADRALGCPH